MNVFVNNEPTSLENASTIIQLLHALHINSLKGIAVAVNNQVIPKNAWENFSVSENDRITLIKATQGG